MKIFGSCVASVGSQKWSFVPGVDDAMHLTRRVFAVVSVVVSPTWPENDGLLTGLVCDWQVWLPELL